MRAFLKILLSIVLVAAFASVAMALTTVSVNGVSTNCAGTLTLSSMTVLDGNVSIALSCSDSSCTNRAPSISCTAPTTATVGTPISATFSASDQDGQTPTVTPNVGTISGNTWTWTPAASGTQIVTLTANDGQSCNNTGSYSWSVAVSGGGGGGGGVTLLPSTGLGMITGQGVSIPALGEQYYYFDLPAAAAQYIQISITTRDWLTNQDLYVSNVSQPTCTGSGNNIPPRAAPWYNTASSANESVWLMAQYPASTRFYVTVCNRASKTGSYGIYWTER